MAAVRAQKPLTLVLPAFPGKSPNLSKVLGPLPDKAESLALGFLDYLGDRIRAVYAPGAQIILCSDGRVFSDIVGMREADVTNYQIELKQMMIDLRLKNLSSFNLDLLGKDNDFTQLRHDLMQTFAKPVDILRARISRGATQGREPGDEEAYRMYCGITRFLVEDSIFPGQIKSRSAIQKECRIKAFEVIRRSNAWSELIAQRFPEALRLSIHPQTCGSKKLGIRLIGAESWLTPWHSVAVKTHEGFVLRKRTEAEALGAQLVLSPSGRPSHFEIPVSPSVSQTTQQLEEHL
jgi:pyoverdine/dityrosine biosynthesis protein Dit1